MLGLGEKVGCHPARVGAVVGDHDHLARPGGEVDPDVRRDEELGGGHVRVPRPDDAVDGGDRRGAVGERGNRLSTADRVDLVQPQFTGDDERGVDRVRGDDHDARDTRHQRGHRGHHERRRQRAPPAGDTAPDRADRSPAALGHDARSSLDACVGRALRLGERAHRRDHAPQRLEHIVLDTRRGDRGGRDTNPVGTRPIEALGPLEERRVTARTDIRHDRRDRRDRIIEERRPHAISLSTGSTRIEDAPASFKAGSSVQTSSASTAA